MDKAIGYIVPVLLWVVLMINQWQINKATRDALKWQHNWEQHGELPLDRVQNARLDKLERIIGIKEAK